MKIRRKRIREKVLSFSIYSLKVIELNNEGNSKKKYYN